MLPLTKTLDPADFALLEPELRTVDQYFTSAREQHPMRRWEYAMALRALNVWRGNRPGTISSYDVGGAGSPFRKLLGPWGAVMVVDPEGEGGDWKSTLADFVQPGTELAHCVFCLSVLEHVDNLDQFLYHLSCLVAPGGLLFLTMDCREDDRELAEKMGDWSWPKDDRHFHWMRKRIFSPRMMVSCIADPLMYLGFITLGDCDWRYLGPHVYDYTFASLALVKRS